MSCARSTQKFSGKEENQKNKNKNNMKRPNGVRAAYAAFSYGYAVGFGCATVLNTLEEAYP